MMDGLRHALVGENYTSATGADVSPGRFSREGSPGDAHGATRGVTTIVAAREAGPARATPARTGAAAGLRAGVGRRAVSARAEQATDAAARLNEQGSAGVRDL